MSSHTLLPSSFRRQQLVLDFASLQPHIPLGLYFTLPPTNPSVWSGVLFIRDPGPYESLLARFTISFPPTYPDVPPIVTFQTDIFHPLIVPLTTYSFGGGAGGDGVSAADVEGRLPPGGFSLRWGFPRWFEGKSLRVGGPGIIAKSLDNGIPIKTGLGIGGEATPEVRSTPARPPVAETATSPASTTSSPFSPTAQADRPADTNKNASTDHPTPPTTLTTTISLLTHLHLSFTSPAHLDALSLSSAGNPSAWHAWRSYRNLSQTETTTTAYTPAREQKPTRGRSPASSPASVPGSDNEHVPSQSSPRYPGAWNWEGVFESRVQSNIEDSISEATLYGTSVRSTGGGFGGGIASGIGSGNAGLIRFEKLDKDRLEEIRAEIREGMEGPTVAS